ncbi:MAG: suppressor of fused domain protein [Clostridia bacterium]|nr:suppressor of fused domain protein [Clostridia bacterium]
MGILDQLKKQNENINKKKEEEEISALGWDAITAECERAYPNQKNPKHYHPIISYRLGGNDPLDGISVYDGGNYWHFVTYGLSELYDKESDIKEVSGYGMEFTFKLKKDKYENEEDEIRCVCGILQSIARITFSKGELFNSFEYVYTRQTEGIDCNRKSNITGFITLPDDTFHEIETPNGKVCFVEFVGVTDRELKAIYNKEIRVRELYEKLGSNITDYNRKSVI